MRKITTIPSKSITFKNVPVLGLFFLKRTLYRKISFREAQHYNENNVVFFQQSEIVKFITKCHENIATEMYENKFKHEKQEKCEFEVNDMVDILSKSTCGKIVSVNRNTCTVQYKDAKKNSISFDDFSFIDLKLQKR